MQEEMSRDATQRMSKCVALLREHYRKMRTGRANTGLLDGLKVDYYGSEVPLNQVASISVGTRGRWWCRPGTSRRSPPSRRPS
jgi:ribosome recycling factor